jgi:hypothetical protein
MVSRIEGFHTVHWCCCMKAAVSVPVTVAQSLLIRCVQWCTKEFCSGEFNKFNLQMSESRILIRLLRMCFPRNWEFGLALSKLWNFVGGWGCWNLPRYATGCAADYLYPTGDNISCKIQINITKVSCLLLPLTAWISGQIVLLTRNMLTYILPTVSSPTLKTSHQDDVGSDVIEGLRRINVSLGS